jgi:hypothetical protein
MYIRNRRDSYDVWSTWTKVLTDRNSSVSGGGNVGGSSITVNIGGTSKTLTIPTSLPANGGNAETVDNYHISVVNSLAATKVNNTIYILV